MKIFDMEHFRKINSAKNGIIIVLIVMLTISISSSIICNKNKKLGDEIFEQKIIELNSMRDVQKYKILNDQYSDLLIEKNILQEKHDKAIEDKISLNAKMQELVEKKGGQ